MNASEPTTATPLHDAPLALTADLAHDLADRAVADGVDAPSQGQAPALAGVARLLGAIDRLIAAIVVALIGAEDGRVIGEEGLTTESWLRAVARRTGADAAMLQAASERLADMPATLAAFTAGALSWGTVRGIVSAVRALTAEQRRWLDEALGGDHARLTDLDSDSVVAAADRLANEVRPDLHQQRADRAAAGQRLMFQPAMDGTGTAFAAMDAETFAAVQQAIGTLTHDAAGRRVASNLEALAALARQRLARAGTSATMDGDGDGNSPRDAGAPPDDASEPPLSGRTSSQDAEPAAADPGGAPSTARPEMLIITDVSLLAEGAGRDAAARRAAGTANAPERRRTTRTAHGIAELLWRTDRPRPTLTPAAVQRLACDATLRPILVDGHRILGTGEPYARVSASLRAALAARDGGCRFPACHRPVDVCDAHHVVHRIDHGPTALDNLALLCRAHHRAVHEGGWHARLNSDGSMTFARRGVKLHSVPRVVAVPGPDRPPPGGRRARGPSKPATGRNRGAPRAAHHDRPADADASSDGPEPLSEGGRAPADALPF